MHQYAVDNDEHTRIPFYLAGIAVFGAWAIYGAISYARLPIPWWVDAPTPLVLYGIAYSFFDQLGWRFGLVQRIGLIRTPDLNGVWSGTLLSSFDDHTTEHAVTLTIVQTWTRMSIELRAGQSRSHSHIAGIANVTGYEPVLSYEYINEPDAGAYHEMHMHRGSAWLRVSGKQRSLTGEYYTGRGRQTYGRMTFMHLS